MEIRLDSGNIQLRQVNAAPMQQIGVRNVDYVGPRAEAQANQTLANIIDRMGQFANTVIGDIRTQQGVQHVIDNPPDEKQLQQAIDGDVSQLIPSGNFTYFDQAVRKARAIQISQAFEREGRNQIVDIANEVAGGKITPDQAKTKIDTLIQGYSKVVAKADGNAALKFNASMAADGHVAYKQALDQFAKREKEKDLIAFRADVDNIIEVYGMYARNQPDLASMYERVAKENILNGASLHGPVVYKEMQELVAKALPEARRNVVLNEITKDEYLSDPRTTEKQLRAGVLGDANMSKLVAWMKVNDREGFAIVMKEFDGMVQARKRAIDATYVDSVDQGRSIERQIYSTTDPKEMNRLFAELKKLPVDPQVIKGVGTWIKEQSKPAESEDNLEVLVQLHQKARAGKLTAGELSRAPLSKGTKRELAKEIGNVNNDIAYGTKLIRNAANMVSDNLPPQFESAEARKLAIDSVAQQESALLKFSYTPNSKGLLPTPSEIRAEGERLSEGVKALMSRSFASEADKNKTSAVMILPELKGVDLTNPVAVEQAIKKAVANKRTQNDINAAKAAIDAHNTNLRSVAKEVR